MSEFKSKVKNHDLNLTVWLKNQNKAVNEFFFMAISLCLSIYRQEVCYLDNKSSSVVVVVVLNVQRCKAL